MTRLEAIITEQLAPVVASIDDKVRVAALASLVNDQWAEMTNLGVENHRLHEAIREALAAIVAGDTRAAGAVLKGALR